MALITTLTRDEIKAQQAVLEEGEIPGPFNMCWHWLKAKHVCILIPNHTGDHAYSKFTVTNEDGSPYRPKKEK